MKKSNNIIAGCLCLIIVLWGASIIQADTATRLVSETVTIGMEVTNYVEARAQLMALIEENKGTIANSGEQIGTPDKRGKFEIHFIDAECRVIADRIEKIGRVFQRNITLRNDEMEYAIQKQKLDETKKRHESLTKLLSLAQEKEQYSLVLAELGRLENDIATINKLLRDIEIRNEYDRLEVEIIEPHLEPMESGKAPLAGWVNMPGIEYVRLQIENKEKGETAQGYQGGALKYLFYRKKMYGILGLLKSNDTVRISEIFVYGFGFDFYSRYFGRGGKQFLNMYHGFLVGGAYNNTDRSLFHLSPHLGIEIVKTRHIILDGRIGYYVPFTHNRKYRGPLMSISFNFLL